MRYDEKMTVDDLRDRFSSHSTWHTYRAPSGHLFLSHKLLKGARSDQYLGYSQGACHKHTLAAAKVRFGGGK